MIPVLKVKISTILLFFLLNPLYLYLLFYSFPLLIMSFLNGYKLTIRKLKKILHLKYLNLKTIGKLNLKNI